MLIDRSRPKLRNHLEILCLQTTETDAYLEMDTHTEGINWYDRSSFSKTTEATQNTSLIPPAKIYFEVYSPDGNLAYLRRVGTDELRSISLTTLVSHINQAYRRQLEHLNLVLSAYEDSLVLEDAGEDEFLPTDSLRLSFTKTQQRRGERYWLICPGCSRRISRLFDGLINAELIWGCQRCLGLSYPSQRQHRMFTHDALVAKGYLRASITQRVAAAERIVRRYRRFKSQIKSKAGFRKFDNSVKKRVLQFLIFKLKIRIAKLSF